MLKEYASVNYKGIWARGLIIWKKSRKFCNCHFAYLSGTTGIDFGAEVLMTSIFIQIMTIKSAGLWEEQSVFSRASLIVTFFILLKTGVGKLQPVGQAKPPPVITHPTR